MASKSFASQSIIQPTELIEEVSPSAEKRYVSKFISQPNSKFVKHEFDISNVTENSYALDIDNLLQKLSTSAQIRNRKNHQIRVRTFQESFQSHIHVSIGRLSPKCTFLKSVNGREQRPHSG